MNREITTLKPSENKTSKTTTLVVTTIASFLIPLMTSSVNVALPAIGSQYNMNVIALSWVSTAYILASAMLLIPFGRIADIYGRNKIFILGIIVFILGSILALISPTGTMLLVSRAIQGIGGAAIFATSLAILISAYPVEERGKVLGINTGFMYFGLSIGPVIGGILTERAGWKSIFILSLVMSTIVIVATFWKIKWGSVKAKKEKFDLTGTIIYSSVMITIMYGISILPQVTGIWLILTGIIAGLIFFWWETRTENPLVQLSLFRHNKVFAFSNIAALINYSGTWAVSFLLSLYLQYNKGLSPEIAGFILISNPLIQAIFSPIAGRLSDRIEPRTLATTGMAATTLGLGMLIFINGSTSLAYVIVSLVILGAGFAFFSSPNTNAIMSSADKQFYGFASATIATSRQIGMMLSMGITMVIFAVVIGRVQITPEYYPAFIKSTRITFLVFTVLCFGAIFASLARGKIRENHNAFELKN